MKEKYLVLWASLVVIFIGTLGVSLSYLGTKVNRGEIYPTNVKTGNLDIKIVDNKLEDINLVPIYDSEYYESAYKKEFSIESKENSLNSCGSLYLDIGEISDELRSEYLKYRLMVNGIVYEGNFKEAKSLDQLLLLDNIFIESGSKINFDLYIWISYVDGVDQSEMLGTKLTAKLVVKSYDSENLNICKKN